MTIRPQIVALAAGGALVAALVVAFATRDGGRDSTAERVAELVPRVEAVIGVPFREPPRVEVRSREEVRRFVEEQLEDSLARTQVAGQEAVLRQLGLIPDTMDLEPLLLAVLAEQISGYYDPRTKALYVVEGADDDVLAATVAHELIHALQDQYVNLDSILRSRGDDDRQAAAQAAIEGQATFDHMRVIFGGEEPAIPGGWQRARELIRSEQSRWPAIAAAPLAIQEMLVFPYLSGFEFVRAVRAANPEAGFLPAELPTSTEQIMHPSLYTGTRDVPLVVTLPPLPGMTTVYENTLGEFPTRLFLYEHLRDQQGAISGARGWGGDRYAVVRTPRGDGLVWVSTWDSLTDGAEFFDLLDRTVDRRYGPSSARTLAAPRAPAGMTRTRLYSVAGRSIAVSTGDIGGRPVVVYASLPAGDDPVAIDLSRIRIRE